MRGLGSANLDHRLRQRDFRGDTTGVSVPALGLPLDILMCNAGIMALPRLQQKYGYELQFFTNHIGHFIFMQGLTGALNVCVIVISRISRSSAVAQ